MRAFNIYLNKKLVDTVYYSDSTKVSKEEVYRSLVYHDGYNSAIKVVPVGKKKHPKRQRAVDSY
jgi:hypothetical protein